MTDKCHLRWPFGLEHVGQHILQSGTREHVQAGRLHLPGVLPSQAASEVREPRDGPHPGSKHTAICQPAHRFDDGLNPAKTIRPAEIGQKGVKDQVVVCKSCGEAVAPQLSGKGDFFIQGWR